MKWFYKITIPEAAALLFFLGFICGYVLRWVMVG